MTHHHYHHHPILLTMAATMALAFAARPIDAVGWCRTSAPRPCSMSSSSLPSSHRSILAVRGGSIRPSSDSRYTDRQRNDGDDDDAEQEEESRDDDDDDATKNLQHQRRQTLRTLQTEYQKVLKYQTEQQLLYQLRSTYLSEILASRGLGGVLASGSGSGNGSGGKDAISLGSWPTLTSVATKEGEKPPERCDWDCALATEEDPKSCLYSFDAEPNTKVISPRGTTQYISLTALNRLRRIDPTKVEPMWHSRYSILHSWFSDHSEYSLLQHVGIKGFLVSSVLLDGMNGMVLKSLLILSILTVFVALMPVLEYIVGRILVSAPFWSQWTTWGRVVRAGFPLKLLLGQLVWKGVASGFGKLEGRVRDYVVDLECEILEESVPLTVGVDEDDHVEGIDVEEEEFSDDVEGEDDVEFSDEENVEDGDDDDDEDLSENDDDAVEEYDMVVDESDFDEYDDDY
mmetsp:Transcript_5201/g.9460  ORF Transcript_5201/g.9460 Transcript_5201/m.9460 type:complete len:458 (+) Transcript_5201:115-1488(+)